MCTGPVPYKEEVVGSSPASPIVSSYLTIGYERSIFR